MKLFLKHRELWLAYYALEAEDAGAPGAPERVTALFNAPIDWSTSFSSALNSASSFFRSSVALSSAAWFLAISVARFLISVLRP